MTIAPGRKALVSGGASGFGLEIARRLRAADAQVGLLDLPGERLERARAELGGDALALPADVRVADDVRRAVQSAIAAFGGLDTLVISAGVIHIKPLGEVSESDWDLTLDVNLKGAFLTAQAAAEALSASGRGRIVAISSDAGRRGWPWLQAYTASKFGLIGLVESLAIELAGAQVTANCVCPVGCPTTGMGQDVLAWKIDHTQSSAEEIVATTARTNPLGRNATEGDVADAVMFFVSEQAAFLTGSALDVDGGARLGFIPGSG
jgi:meso-butanediol dehydrogenase / (S,S)-butanediol dehydrogenase / diacetyl reductase